MVAVNPIIARIIPAIRYTQTVRQDLFRLQVVNGEHVWTP